MGEKCFFFFFILLELFSLNLIFCFSIVFIYIENRNIIDKKLSFILL